MVSVPQRIQAIGRWGSPTRIDSPLVLDLALLVLFAIVRGANNDVLLGAWLVVAGLVAIRWPGSGLGLAAAICILPQPTRIGLLPSFTIVAAAAIGIAIDAAANGVGPARRRWIAAALVGVVMIVAATAVGLVRTLVRVNPEPAVEATRRWLELGSGLVFLVLLIRAFGIGSRRPLVLGLIGITVGLAVAVIDYVAPDLLPSLRGRWLVFGTDQSRATGPFASPNRLGTVAAVAVIVGGLEARAGGRWRWAWAAFGTLGLAALTLSYSRGALLGLLVAGGAILALRSRRAALIYAGVAIVAAVIAVPILVGARLAGSGGTLDILLSNDLGRFDAWLAGLRMIVAEPLFGHGYHSFATAGAAFGATDELATAHNEAIGLWAENGIVAFAGYVLLVVGCALAALERRGDAWAVAALGALIVFFVASSFNIQLMFLAVAGPVWLVVAYGIARPAAGPADPREAAT